MTRDCGAARLCPSADRFPRVLPAGEAQHPLRSAVGRRCPGPSPPGSRSARLAGTRSVRPQGRRVVAAALLEAAKAESQQLPDEVAGVPGLTWVAMERHRPPVPTRPPLLPGCRGRRGRGEGQALLPQRRTSRRWTRRAGFSGGFLHRRPSGRVAGRVLLFPVTQPSLPPMGPSAHRFHVKKKRAFSVVWEPPVSGSLLV